MKHYTNENERCCVPLKWGSKTRKNGLQVQGDTKQERWKEFWQQWCDNGKNKEKSKDYSYVIHLEHPDQTEATLEGQSRQSKTEGTSDGLWYTNKRFFSLCQRTWGWFSDRFTENQHREQGWVEVCLDYLILFDHGQNHSESFFSTVRKKWQHYLKKRKKEKQGKIINSERKL